MKKSILSILLIAFSAIAVAQAPQGLSYQAIAFDGNGVVVTNETVGVRVSILDNSATGTLVYEETHSPTTNDQGLYNFNIGQGSATSGTFSNINWGVNAKFLTVEVDATGGTNYTVTGSNELMSVPYALFAEESNTVINGVDGNLSANGNFLVYDYNEAYAWNSNTSTWAAITTTTSAIDGVISSGPNFLIYDFNEAYAWSEVTGLWTSVTTTTSAIDSVAGSNGNFVVYDYNEAYAWNSLNGTWTTTTTTTSAIDGTLSSNGNILIWDYNEAQAWSSLTDTWYTITTQTSAIDGAIGANGNFLVYDYNEAYAWNATTGIWTPITTQTSAIDGILGTE